MIKILLSRPTLKPTFLDWRDQSAAKFHHVHFLYFRFSIQLSKSIIQTVRKCCFKNVIRYIGISVTALIEFGA